MASSRHAFSLVELSIVLVILGLLLGGILAGSSLIRAAELRSATSEFARYSAAIITFRDKYSANPGDMSNAVKYWGAAAGSTNNGVDATCANLTTASTNTTTCNGNGDDKIGNFYYGPSLEAFRVWQHLVNAGLIEGSYSGVTDSATATDFFFKIGTNAPVSRMKNAGWSYYFVQPMPAGDTYEWTPSNPSGWWYKGTYGNVMFLGSLGAYKISTRGGALRPDEAYSIDKKMDDGQPNTGKIYSDTPTGTSYQGQSSCALSTSYAYDLTQTEKTCSLIFFTD